MRRLPSEKSKQRQAFARAVAACCVVGGFGQNLAFLFRLVKFMAPGLDYICSCGCSGWILHRLTIAPLCDSLVKRTHYVGAVS
mmetsp:Transcript_77235/g.153312  ORF Transcript_77235/g.153312 Transcript_77235/m.153312 type:complete len:83 (-) Transcript_77235:215-463(-)